MDFGAILCSHKVSKLTIQRSRNAIVESTVQDTVVQFLHKSLGWSGSFLVNIKIQSVINSVSIYEAQLWLLSEQCTIDNRQQTILMQPYLKTYSANNIVQSMNKWLQLFLMKLKLHEQFSLIDEKINHMSHTHTLRSEHKCYLISELMILMNL